MTPFKVIWLPIHANETDSGPCVQKFDALTPIIDYEITTGGEPSRPPRPCCFRIPVKWARFERKPITVKQQVSYKKPVTRWESVTEEREVVVG